MTNMRLQPFSASWMQAQLQRIHKADPSKTVGIMVHQSEIKDGSLDSKILPAGLSKSDDFRKDLNMGNAYWYYH